MEKFINIWRELQLSDYKKLKGPLVQSSSFEGSKTIQCFTCHKVQAFDRQSSTGEVHSLIGSKVKLGRSKCRSHATEDLKDLVCFVFLFVFDDHSDY